MNRFQEITGELELLKDPAKSKLLAGFFKTKKGEYAEGDVFLGITVPKQRLVARKYKSTDLETIQKLLNSKIHEFRLTALFILIGIYQKSDRKEQEQIISLYLRNTKNINNWDLVDLSAGNILGNNLYKGKDKTILFTLAKSKNLWERRIAIIATSHFIKNHDFASTLKIAEMLLHDKHDLIHKAVGWMLREVGKKDQETEEFFLQKYYRNMPRTMLRYAIEKFDKKKRNYYLGKRHAK